MRIPFKKTNFIVWYLLGSCILIDLGIGVGLHHYQQKVFLVLNLWSPLSKSSGITYELLKDSFFELDFHLLNSP